MDIVEHGFEELSLAETNSKNVLGSRLHAQRTCVSKRDDIMHLVVIVRDHLVQPLGCHEVHTSHVHPTRLSSVMPISPAEPWLYAFLDNRASCTLTVSSCHTAVSTCWTIIHNTLLTSLAPCDCCLHRAFHTRCALWANLRCCYLSPTRASRMHVLGQRSTRSAI